ncbi:MAG: DNA polymerase III subunit alpha [Pseudomonadota bacterium]|nr:DNA polymerase III subunit alpha [Pseudomonadota bacterium]
MKDSYIHLNVHTEYSIADGIIKIPQLVERCKKQNFSAVAVTDLNNLFSAIKFNREAKKAGIKPIIGSEVTIMPSDTNLLPFNVIFLCKNKFGYKNLCEILTLCQQRKEDQVGVTETEISRSIMEGIIVISGDQFGDIGQAILKKDMEFAKKRLNWWESLVGDNFFCQISKLNKSDELQYLNGLAELSKSTPIRPIATNQVRFLEKKEFIVHEARVCIQQGVTLEDSRRIKSHCEEQFFCTESQMKKKFRGLEVALINSVKVATKCNFDFEEKVNLLPLFPISSNINEADFLREQALEGLNLRLKDITEDNEEGKQRRLDSYKERMEQELKVIVEMGFSGYFLIVADFIKWAKEQRIPVGPGRGSGAGSLVAYLLSITELDPLRYDLLFERFLNPERISMPDFDIDFCMDRRDEVIDYVGKRYGADRVAQIITFGKMAAKAVIRDVGRVLGLPYPQVDQVAKLVPNDIGITLSGVLNNKQSDLSIRCKEDADIKNLLGLALKLEGTVRNAGKHAGGLVIAPEPLVNYMPLYSDKDTDGMLTQFDMGDVEAIGLVKFDLLGLRTLTIVDWAVDSIKSMGKGRDLNDINRITLNDSKTYKTIRDGKTTSIFQLESRGMRELISRLKPDKFEDLVALVALFRPGPLDSGMVDDFIAVKLGRPAKYLHPNLERSLKSTYGVILYQEQVMEIARSLSGYTLGSADILRRAMGKKKPEEMASQRTTFVSGAVARNIPEKIALDIFALIEKFAGYGFNKSHSAAYALIAYQTAWLKSNYPSSFMASVLSSDMDNTDKVVLNIRECNRLEIEVLPPDINKSDFKFRAINDSQIRYGMGAIKGLGRNMIEAIINERTKKDFVSASEICQRVTSQKLNKRIFEIIVKSGLLDSFGLERGALLSQIETILKIADQERISIEHGQADLFGLDLGQTSQIEIKDTCNAVLPQKWTNLEILKAEKDVLGCFLSGHPLDENLKVVKSISNHTISDLGPGRSRLVGLILSFRVIDTRRGRLALIELDDKTGSLEVVMNDDIFNKYIDSVIIDDVVVVEGAVSKNETTGFFSLKASYIGGIDNYLEKFAYKLSISVPEKSLDKGFVAKLKKILLKSESGGTRVNLDIISQNSKARFDFGAEWSIKMNTRAVADLNTLLSSDNISISYKSSHNL